MTDRTRSEVRQLVQTLEQARQQSTAIAERMKTTGASRFAGQLENMATDLEAAAQALAELLP